MPSTDPRIDAYIARAADFAQPILAHLRGVVHAACPGVEETMKWSFPHFMYGGGILCSMASFKEHCAFGFWQGAAVLEGEAIEAGKAMGNFGRITSLKDLPPKRELVRLVKKAMALRDSGVKAPPRRAGASKAPVRTPADLQAALSASEAARATWDAFPPSHRREYVEWITEAKRDETRARRIAQAIASIAEGRGRNWKYERPEAGR